MTEGAKPRFFATPAALRAWLEKNHARAAELWVGFHKRATGKPSVTWPQSVDQALCFGWIDGVRKSLGDESYMIRFTPRKPRSTWSAINIRRVGELTAAGLMRPAGLAAFRARDEKRSVLYSYERGNARTLPAECEAALRANAKAWAHWESRPPWYRRTSTHWVVSAKKEETRARRLATLIACCAAGRAIPPLALGEKKK